jgi:hypothetical protein
MPTMQRLLEYIPDDWPKDGYVLCGSAALAVRGVRDVRDLDILVWPQLWPDVEKRYCEGYWPKREGTEPAKDGQSNDGPRRQLIITGWFDFFTEPPRIASGIGAAGVFRNAEQRPGWPGLVQSLRQVLAIKALACREQDLDDMIRLAHLIAEEERRAI